MRRKGDSEWFDLGDHTSEEFRGIEVKLQHVGPGIMRKWQLKFQRWQLSERARTNEFCDEYGLSKDEFNDQYGGVTFDGAEESATITKEVLSECVVGIRGLPDHSSMSDPSEIISELERLGAMESILPLALDMQRLRPELSLGEGSRSLESDGPAANLRGPGSDEGSRAGLGAPS